MVYWGNFTRLTDYKNILPIREDLRLLRTVSPAETVIYFDKAYLIAKDGEIILHVFTGDHYLVHERIQETVVTFREDFADAIDQKVHFIKNYELVDTKPGSFIEFEKIDPFETVIDFLEDVKKELKDTRSGAIKTRFVDQYEKPDFTRVLVEDS